MRAKRRRQREMLQIWLSVLILSVVSGTVIARYIYSEEFQGEVVFSASLAESVDLWESKALRQEDGTYTLTAEKVNENNYILLPGVDIPKDPYIVIKEKTPLKAYLYVEVVDAIKNNAIQYEIADNWELINGFEGAHGGLVYIYKGTGQEPLVLDETFTDQPVYILKENQVRVSQYLNLEKTDDILSFYGCLGEIPTDEERNDPVEIYQSVYRISE